MSESTSSFSATSHANSCTLFRTSFPVAFKTLQDGVAEGVAPGFVAGVWQAAGPQGGTHDLVAVGNRRLTSASLLAQPMEVNTVFDLASVTKVMGTATLAAVLVDRGWITWETPLQALVPEYRFPEIRLKHLLSHTAGIPAWFPLFEKIRAHYPLKSIHQVPVSERQKLMRKLVTDIPPEHPVGKVAVYSDLSFLLLGFALEEATGMPLDRAVMDFVFRPMGLATAHYVRTTQSVESARNPRVAATEDCPWRGGVVQGQVHDDNCWAMGGYAGHAGAFADAADVLKFSVALMKGFVSPCTLHKLWTRVDEPVGCDRTLGWDTPSGSEPSFTKRFSPLSVGHLGFTGTSLWIDPDRQLAVTLLSNRVHPTRENTLIKAFRGRFHEALWQDLKSVDSSS
ncbi:MAG: beta-lactamase family protein [Methylotenera sp.]|nr:beta-lactamase family protein [Oligoflexia bacterium]